MTSGQPPTKILIRIDLRLYFSRSRLTGIQRKNNDGECYAGDEIDCVARIRYGSTNICRRCGACFPDGCTYRGAGANQAANQGQPPGRPNLCLHSAWNVSDGLLEG